MNIGRILTLEEVADFLKTSVKTVRRRVASGKLKAFKEGGRVLVLEAELEEYIRRQIAAPFNS